MKPKTPGKGKPKFTASPAINPDVIAAASAAMAAAAKEAAPAALMEAAAEVAKIENTPQAKPPTVKKKAPAAPLPDAVTAIAKGEPETAVPHTVALPDGTYAAPGEGFAAAEPSDKPVATGYVETKVKDNSTGKEVVLTQSSEAIPVEKFLTEVAHVNLELGLTLNLANYESARVTVGLSMPCYKEQADHTWTFVKQWVADRVFKEVAEVRAAHMKTKAPQPPSDF